MGFLLSDKGSSYKKHLGKFSPIKRQKEHERYKNKRFILFEKVQFKIVISANGKERFTDYGIFVKRI